MHGIAVYIIMPYDQPSVPLGMEYFCINYFVKLDDGTASTISFWTFSSIED